ncbi:MAG: membrane-binding protein [Sphingobacteriaceae bacterium]|nr:membrane-binding protein [Sphingobacteriaceae bacterium]
MEMVFTAARALLVIKGVIALLFLVSCKQSHNKRELIGYNVDSIDLKNVNGVFHNGEEPLTGLLYALHPKGDSVFSRSYVNGLEDGLHKQWYSNSTLQEKRHYLLGKKEGLSLGYWPDGTRRYLYQFIADLHEGIQYEWYSNGKLCSKKNYRGGYESGLQQSWNPDGSIKSNYEARNGRNYGNIGKKNCYSVWEDSAFVVAH